MSSNEYDPSAFPPFAVTVDLVVLTVRPPSMQVLLVRRGDEPDVGRLALPGGFVGPAQDLHEAAEAKLVDKTGVRIDRAHLEQLETFGAPNRDSRMRIVSVAHLAMVSDPETPANAEARWHDVASVADADVAFDHSTIVEAGVERARSKLEYTTLATSFCPDEFTIGDLRAVYEAVWGIELDPANFHRKVMATDGFVVPTGRTTSVGRGRPARTYRAGDASQLQPSIARTPG